MEQLYSGTDKRVLHLLRINHMQPLYSDVDIWKLPMANWALDGIIELIQKYYHEMNFDDSLEG
eukprot:14862633-Ditylum_brightwellii.AAC.1